MKPTKRIRNKVYFEKDNGFYTVWTSTGSLLRTVDTLVTRSSEYTNQRMVDYISTGTRRYQDCENEKLFARYYYRAGLSLLDYLNIADGPLITGQSVRQYPISRLVQDSSIFAETRLQHNLRTPSAIKAFESPFRDSSIPRSVNIEIDPFDTGFSIWFLLADVYQMKGLWRSLLGSGAMSRRFRAFTSRSGRETAKQLANDHLAIQFGLLPTIRDIQEFVQLIFNWTSRFDKMKEGLGKTRPWYEPATDLIPTYYEKSLEFSGISTVVEPGFHTIPVMMRAEVETSSALHRRTVSYCFTCPEFQGWVARLKQFIDAFGIIDPAAIWDAIPFSFIVDWFFGIGNWLHKNRPRLFPADVVIRDYCESISVRTNVKWYASYWSPEIPQQFPAVAPHLVPEHFIGSEEYTTYVRRRFIPDIGRISAPRSGSGVSIRRAIIAAALVAQRLPR